MPRPASTHLHYLCRGTQEAIISPIFLLLPFGIAQPPARSVINKDIRPKQTTTLPFLHIHFAVCEKIILVSRYSRQFPTLCVHTNGISRSGWLRFQVATATAAAAVPLRYIRIYIMYYFIVAVRSRGTTKIILLYSLFIKL